MQFAGQSAAVASVGKHATHQDFIRGDRLTVLPAPRRSGVATRQEGGPTGSTNRTLTIGLRKGDTVINKPVDMRRANPWISE